MPSVFKKIKINMEMVSIDEYKQDLHHPDKSSRKTAVVEDIQKRLEQLTPFCDKQPYNQK